MARSLLFTFFLLFCGFAAALKLERAQKLTNAARFQAGLPPLPPTKREAGMKPRGSSVSPNQCPGKTYIALSKSSHPFGHLGSHVSPTTGQFDLLTSSLHTEWLQVQTTFDQAAHDVKLTNTDSAYKYLGVADPSNGSLMELGFGYLVASNQTTAGAKPTAVGNSRTPSNPGSVSESHIWTVDPSSHSIYPIFVDADGVQVSAQGVVKQTNTTAGKSGWTVEFVGDWAQFSTSAGGEGWEKADLYLECGW